MIGLVKLANVYGSREDQLIERLEQGIQEKDDLLSQKSPELEDEQMRMFLKNLGIGGGAGALGGLGLAHLTGNNSFKGAGWGAALGGLTGAATGAYKAETLFERNDPELYEKVMQAKRNISSAEDALGRHQELREKYSPVQQVRFSQEKEM